MVLYLPLETGFERTRTVGARRRRARGDYPQVPATPTDFAMTPLRLQEEPDIACNSCFSYIGG